MFLHSYLIIYTTDSVFSLSHSKKKLKVSKTSNLNLDHNLTKVRIFEFDSEIFSNTIKKRVLRVNRVQNTWRLRKRGEENFGFTEEGIQ